MLDLKAFIGLTVPDILLKIYLKKIKGDNCLYADFNDLYKCIFIHIPKTAGISISKTLFNVRVGHKSIRKYEIYNKMKFKNYYKFTFVRNPWDRILSAFTFLKSGGINEYDKKWGEKYLSRYENLNDFIIDLQNHQFKNQVFKHMHFKPQYKFICDERLNLKVDFVGRFENINHDFDIVRKNLGIERELIKSNTSKHVHYSEYYTSETKDIVAKLYALDIKLLKYSFNT